MSAEQRETEPTESARQHLERLGQSGKFLFHGTPTRDITEFEPRQAHNYDHTTGKNIPDGAPAVFAADRPDVAIFMALVNRTNSIDDTNGWSGSGIRTENGVRTAEFRATKNLIDGARLPSARGIVYVFDRESFEPRSPNGSEWSSLKPVSPIESITVRSTDFPEAITEIATEPPEPSRQ